MNRSLLLSISAAGCCAVPLRGEHYASVDYRVRTPHNAARFRPYKPLSTGFPVRSVDMQRATDNITIRQGDTAIISSGSVTWSRQLRPSGGIITGGGFIRGKLIVSTRMHTAPQQ
ncbi:unnamed protein product [Pleuronectes platessa]|uniref:Uncharacterized protein n=1 Tax=Pleuronectes platessa TaxID=8262 RepID=A0A9N7TMX0_PLEPL|nr:unnamed protein product [Pleuronectes platessa]